jgi:BlaI family penicillinase repressor
MRKPPSNALPKSSKAAKPSVKPVPEQAPGSVGCQPPEAVMITDAEWEVMSLLWSTNPLSATEVAAEVARGKDWKLSTVKTLLSRLADKKAVTFVQRGREYLYSPAVPRAAAVRAQSGSFITRFFGGALAPMVAHFITEHNISEQEIADLRRLLDTSARSENGEERL